MGLFNRGQRQPEKVQTDGVSPEADEVTNTAEDELMPAESADAGSDPVADETI